MTRSILFGALALWYAPLGLVMALAPESWWQMAPGAAQTGPFNMHFVRDVGFAFIGAGFGFAAYARSAQAVLAAVTGGIFVGLHALSHVVEIAMGHGHGPVVAELFGVILPGLLPIPFLLLTREARHA